MSDKKNKPLTVEPLSAAEAAELSKYEAVVSSGMKKFVEVGTVLLLIRSKRLYREKGTFEDYCQAKWGFTRNRGNQLIAAAKLVNEHGDLITGVIKTERDAREVIAEANAGAAPNVPTAEEFKEILQRRRQEVADKKTQGRQAGGGGSDSPPRNPAKEGRDAICSKLAWCLVACRQIRFELHDPDPGEAALVAAVQAWDEQRVIEPGNEAA